MECGSIDLDWLRKNRDQLFAEAVVLFNAGRKWWFLPRQATETVQSNRLAQDPWIDRISMFVAARNRVTSQEILNDLSVDPSKQGTSMQTRVGNAMKQIPGWNKRRISESGARVYCWEREVALGDDQKQICEF